uniref:Uncharacterized protein n=1 Tax=Mus musculus TaxID=10090 RepID=Q9D4T5_MOUSE|nr:unnamed protein product [Mus musculus]
MGGPITSWALYHPKCSIKAVGESATGRVFCLRATERSGKSIWWVPIGREGEKTGHSVTCGGQPGGRLQQQWQQKKKRVRTTTRGNPRSTARQTVLKTPLSCLIRMVSQTELKKELFLSMVLV